MSTEPRAYAQLVGKRKGNLYMFFIDTKLIIFSHIRTSQRIEDIMRNRIYVFENPQFPFLLRD
jgi:hypothetical protein